ncbi:MAG: TonB-dependent receptor [Chitinophagales bacterium]|nr:TonB-dependent receptor [Chitinophagales bacterium]
MRILLSIAVLLLFRLSSLYAQTGEITGQVVDDKKSGVFNATVGAYQNGRLITGAVTDFDGYYVIKPLNPGKYDLTVTYIGMDTTRISGVVVNADKITTLDFTVAPKDVMIKAIEIVWKAPIVKKGNESETTVRSEDIANLATRDVNSISSLSANVYQADEKSGLNIKGAREDGTEYVIDGVRVRGSTKVPAQGIEELTVITGGIPAKYGDATGGIISITTKGPSSDWGGSVEGATSKGMDAYGYTLGSFDLTGPLVKRKKGTDEEESVVGFYVAGEYLRQEDPTPSAVGVWVAKDDTLKYLEANPLVPAQTSDAFIVTTETVTQEGIENVKTKPNVVSNGYSLSGKFDIKPSKTINLTFGGNYNYVRYHDWVDRYTMFNYVNNPLYNDNTWRVFGRFRQRFASNKPDDAADGEGSRKTAFQNANYSVQFDYTKVYDKYEDDSHGFDPFNYGYLGNYDVLKQPIYDYANDPVSGKEGWTLLGYQDTLVRFAPSTINPTGTAFPNKYYELAGATFENGWWTTPQGGAQDGFYQSLDQVLVNGGMRNGDRPRVPHDIWYNTGRQFNGYGINNDDDQFRLSVLGSVDVLPGGSARNKHGIEFGFEFEQRVDRGYSVTPIGLWELMRQLANKHIDQLNLDNPKLLIDGEIYDYNDPNAPAFGQNDTILYDRQYVADQQSYFDKSLRNKLGLPVDNTDFINIDALSPDFYSLDMFSADELLNNGNPYAAWFGYDHLGNKLNSDPSFDDFFKKKDANGNFTREIGAFRPIYSSAYIQDKFNFKDLLFNVGVRVDRYDANQKILNDRYLLYQAYTVEEASSRLDGDVPTNIGNDYVVYVDDFNKSNPVPVGYRDGDTWYTADGTETNSAQIIAKASSTGRITPFLVNPNDNIKSEDFEPSNSFKDYEPQITVMPRLAFSFNLTEQSSFFAHYDILTQRPQSRLQTTPDVWYFFDENITSVINNPNLKPEKTIDYELGFQQKISDDSYVTFTAFYREMKDMIQVVNVAYAYPRDYQTFGNVDFGTVKGFSMTFGMRSSDKSNLNLRFNYTIQFAEGTGSNSTSQLNLIGSGQPNLRTIAPLDFDSRHLINLTIDYDFGNDTYGNYKGPRTKKGKAILSDLGFNITARTRSGEPYTKQNNATAEALLSQATRKILTGSLNGSRLPWNFRLDLRVWKDFNLTPKKKDAEGKVIPAKRDLRLNVYVLIQNVLNTQNIINIYPYTGNPGDDGYLTSEIGQQDITGKVNATSYQDLYRAFINQPGNFSLPRHVRIGGIFSF